MILFFSYICFSKGVKENAFDLTKLIYFVNYFIINGYIKHNTLIPYFYY